MAAINSWLLKCSLVCACVCGCACVCLCVRLPVWVLAFAHAARRMRGAARDASSDGAPRAHAARLSPCRPVVSRPGPPCNADPVCACSSSFQSFRRNGRFRLYLDAQLVFPSFEGPMRACSARIQGESESTVESVGTRWSENELHKDWAVACRQRTACAVPRAMLHRTGRPVRRFRLYLDAQLAFPSFEGPLRASIPCS